MKAVVPLDPTEFQKPLGPGYKGGWYAWRSLGDRKDDCIIESSNTSYSRILKERYAEVLSEISRDQSYEEFCQFFEESYHSKGHIIVAKACSTTFSPPESSDGKPYGMGGMAFSEVSARDPIFYQWHSHVEDMVQAYRDKQLPK